MPEPAEAPPQAATVRKAEADELRRLAEVVARALYEDASLRWLLPEDERRQRILERSLDLWLRRLWFPQNECYLAEQKDGAGQGIVGTAIWGLPGKKGAGLLQQLRLLPAVVAAYGGNLGRLVSAISAMRAHQPREPHFYLAFIGVAPEWQSRGIGSSLLRPVLERCDLEGVPAYLEASTRRNRALYERHGFEVMEEFRLGKASPPIWGMWRPPQ